MFLLILDKDPVISAERIPDKIKFKQLIELGQLVCSAGYSNVYKKINQGKELQNWVRRNYVWVKKYMTTLYILCDKVVNMSSKTQKNILDIISSIPYEIRKDKDPETAIFRYSKDYKSIFPTNCEITIENAIEEYKKYIVWKQLKGVKGYV